MRGACSCLRRTHNHYWSLHLDSMFEELRYKMLRGFKCSGLSKVSFAEAVWVVVVDGFKCEAFLELHANFSRRKSSRHVTAPILLKVRGKHPGRWSHRESLVFRLRM